MSRQIIPLAPDLLEDEDLVVVSGLRDPELKEIDEPLEEEDLWEKLNLRQIAYVKAYFEHRGNKKSAALAAGYSPNISPSQIESCPAVREYLKFVRGRMIRASGVTRDSILADIEEAKREARRDRSWKDVVNALKLEVQILGLDRGTPDEGALDGEGNVVMITAGPSRKTPSALPQGDVIEADFEELPDFYQDPDIADVLRQNGRD